MRTLKVGEINYMGHRLVDDTFDCATKNNCLSTTNLQNVIIRFILSKPHGTKAMPVSLLKFANAAGVRKYLQALSTIYFVPNKPGNYWSFAAECLTSPERYEAFLKTCTAERCTNHVFIYDVKKWAHNQSTTFMFEEHLKMLSRHPDQNLQVTLLAEFNTRLPSCGLIKPNMHR
jgi:hypothetical protein